MIVTRGLSDTGLMRYTADGTLIGELPLEPASEWEDVRRPAWSPDGSALAFISDHTASNEWRLAVVGAAGGTPRVLVSDRRGISGLAWSPDGQWLAFSRRSRDRMDMADLYVVSLADGRTVPILQETDFGIAGPITWSPDCSTLAFAGWKKFDYVDDTNTHEVIDVWRMSLPSRSRERLTFGAIRPSTLEYSPDGRTLLLDERVHLPIPGDPHSYGLASRLQTMPAGGGTRTTIYEPILSDRPGEGAWSPDGTRILYVPSWMGMWSMAPDGSDRRRLTADGTATWTQPAWQPVPGSGTAPPVCDPLGERSALPTPAGGAPPRGAQSPPAPGASTPPPSSATAGARITRVALGWMTTGQSPRYGSG